MSKWVATTLSGAKYEGDGQFVRITGSSYQAGVTTINAWVMKAPKEGVEETHFPWAAPEEWEDVDIPVVGRSLYVQGREEWRISTPIKTLDILED